MKSGCGKVVISMLTCGAAASALAQGTVVFENSSSVGNITLNSPSGPYAAAGTYTVALLWAPGGHLGTAQSQFIQVATYGPAGTSTGFFTDPNVVTIAGQTPGAVGVFEVQGWLGNYSNYAQAIAAGQSHIGQTAEFLNLTGNPNPPATPPVNTTGWDGNLVLGDPEPSTIAIAGLGAGLVWYTRRRKSNARNQA